MNWKEFLKPDWRKIVLMLLIPSLGSISFFLSWILGGFFKSRILFEILIALTFYLGYPFSIGSVFGYLVGLIFGSIFYYLISCLIVWIYNKIKKR
jgi:hypothetical protein